MAKVVKVGNSLGVTIPREIAETLDLKAGDDVEIKIRGSLFEVVPVVMRPKLQPKLQKAVDRTVEKFGPALERLAE